MSDELQAATSSPSSSPRRPLVPDEIRSSLLRKITEEGGFAYVTSIEAAASAFAAAGDLRAAEAAREMAWEQLHSGPWHEVGSAWRDAYAMACLHVASLRAAAGDLREAMKVLDMGIIMGGPLLRKDLDAALERIKATPVAMRRGSEEGGMLAGESSEKWDSQEQKKCEFRCFISKQTKNRMCWSFQFQFQQQVRKPSNPVVTADGNKQWRRHDPVIMDKGKRPAETVAKEENKRGGEHPLNKVIEAQDVKIKLELGKDIGERPPLFIPYSGRAPKEREKLAKMMGVLVLGPGQSDVNEAIEVPMDMTEMFRTRNWEPIRCGERKFMVEFPIENALKYVSSC